MVPPCILLYLKAYYVTKNVLSLDGKELLFNLGWTQLARVDSVTLSQQAAGTCSAIYSRFYKNQLNTVKAYSSSEIRVVEKYAVEAYFLGVLLHVYCIISQ